eukprot:TRINITY_DN423_c4_g3_i1.p1 TRINITY_DN423_c4_g3~~TRINITY_DN423_c4_g3_i1.p1  ORF type:complete len:514 (+),score=175.22 TRINITY_DN423_c4_g3_i1:116-1657(+)
MVSWWLVIVAIVGVFLTAGVSFYLVALYSSIEDRNQAWFPKIVVTFGLTLSGFTVLLLPYDVANRQDPTIMDSAGGGIDTAVCWNIVLGCILVMVLFITPFTTFYYEAWDPEYTGMDAVQRQVRPALCYTMVIAFIFFMMFIILWFSAGQAVLPFKSYSAPPMSFDLSSTAVNIFAPQSGIGCFCDQTGAACATNPTREVKEKDSACSFDSGSLEIKVSSFVYMIGLLCAFGWIFFVVFGGVGLIALPIDLVNDWRMRPQKMSKREFDEAKTGFAAKVAEMVEYGQSLAQREEAGGRDWFGGTRKKINKYKADVQQLEDDWERLQESDPSKDKDRKILKAWLKLPLGILGSVVSLLWVLHIILHNLTGVHPFLNNFFSGLDGFFPVLGVICYSAFAIWMLWAAVKGCFKLGLNFGVIQIHPMKVDGTLMSSFLFNTMIVLLVSVVVTQFCAMSFRMYAANTVVDGIFMTYVTNLKGIGFIMQYFQVAMVIFMGLAAVWLGFKPCCCPDKQERD